MYYKPATLHFNFDILRNSPQTRRFICDQVIAGTCSGIVPAENHTNCIADLEKLPATTGDEFHFDGNSQGCRALHASFAPDNPNHCAHVSLVPMAVVDGYIKCQKTPNVHPSELFTDYDFAYFDDFMIDHGVDPKYGYNEDCSKGLGLGNCHKPHLDWRGLVGGVGMIAFVFLVGCLVVQYAPKPSRRVDRGLESGGEALESFVRRTNVE